MTSQQREKLRPLFHKMGDDLIAILTILEGDFVKTQEFIDKAFFAARIVYERSVENPATEEMTYDQFRAWILNSPAREGTMEWRFKKMVEHNTEDGATNWLFDHVDEFSGSLKESVLAYLRDKADRYPCYMNKAIAIGIRKGKTWKAL